MTRECKQCNRPFPVRARKGGGRRPEFCSAKCRLTHHRAYRRLYANRRTRKTLRAGRLRWKYGLSIAEWDALYWAQDGGCAGCGRAREANGHRLAVDHDHKTGRIRGLLCKRCNQLLGKVEDNSTLLRRLANYLETPKPLLEEGELTETKQGSERVEKTTS